MDLYQLFGFSFWRHPFTAEDPLVSKWSSAEFLQICSHEETNNLLDGLKMWDIFIKVSFLGDLFLSTLAGAIVTSVIVKLYS